MDTRLSWDETFMAMVYTIAERSHDPRSKIGSVVASPDRSIRSVGYNGLPRGIKYRSDIMIAPEKYKWMCHAEENAILNATRSETSLVGCTLYVNLLPCNACARACIQAGIAEVVVHKEAQEFYQKTSSENANHWDSLFACTLEMFSESGVQLRWLNYQIVKSQGLLNGQIFV